MHRPPLLALNARPHSTGGALRQGPLLSLLAVLFGPSVAEAAPPAPDPARGAALYARYCALCHGAAREGHAADHAPSLRSPELLGAAPPAYLWSAVAWGRPGTAMAAYADTQGGPLGHDDMHHLLDWIAEQAAAPRVELGDAPVVGDAALGRRVYGERCATCHGAAGEGGQGNALGNPVFLATASDAFLRHAIARGRSGTPMPAFEGVLSEAELDGVTAFLRSRAVGWTAPEPVRVVPPPPERAVVNPTGAPAALVAREGRFVAADDVKRALDEGRRLVLLDARALSDWQRGHLPGALPVPYYDGVDAIVPHLPRDGTWIVVYCACPHTASGRVVDALRARGFDRAVILDEGVLVWAGRGYPLAIGGGG